MAQESKVTLLTEHGLALYKEILIVALASLILLVSVRSEDILPEEHVADYCNFKSFNASCPASSVILMTQAQYGRMKLGECMEQDYFIGCSSNVINQADRRCSGRRQCTIDVPDSELHEIPPCPRDLGRYLRAGYRCMEVINDFRYSCLPNEPIRVEATSGYLSSIVTMETNFGSSRCPWKLRVAKGQRINITLFDFGVDQNLKKEDNTYCPVYAKIKEPGETRETPICGDVLREKKVYTSDGNEVEISIEVASSREANQHFFLKYEAIGCATPTAPANGWVQRDGQNVVIGCNRTSKKWHLVCQDTHWVGEYGNCTKAGKMGQVFTAEGDFPFGLVVSIVIGIVLGVVIGVTLLAVVLACRKRKQREREAGLVFERPYGPGAGDLGYGAGDGFQKWGPGAHGAQTYSGSSYAHIWELKQHPGAGGDQHQQQQQQYRDVPRSGDVGRGVAVPGSGGQPPSGAALIRCQSRSPKEHIYESPKFERKDSLDSYADPPPFYHEFDMDNPPPEPGAQGGGGGSSAGPPVPGSAVKAFRYNIDDSRYSS